jgi:membrane-bound serine protease (ClpP class)
LKTTFLILVILFLTYEFIEHVVFPLFWSLFQKKKKSSFGPGRILDDIGEVKEWQDKEGYVFVGGELWKAVSDAPLKAGNKVVVQEMKGLILVVNLQNRDQSIPQILRCLTFV